MNKSISVLHKY